MCQAIFEIVTERTHKKIVLQKRKAVSKGSWLVEQVFCQLINGTVSQQVHVVDEWIWSGISVTGIAVDMCVQDFPPSFYDPLHFPPPFLSLHLPSVLPLSLPLSF